jgi:hypothetical protein
LTLRRRIPLITTTTTAMAMAMNLEGLLADGALLLQVTQAEHDPQYHQDDQDRIFQALHMCHREFLATSGT